MLHVCLFANASETRFLSRMSSRSGEDLSGRNGTKIGPLACAPPPAAAALPGPARLGCGACMAAVLDGRGGAEASVAGEGSGIGYCEGAAGFGRRPEVLVNGWTARGSKDARTEDLDMVVVVVAVVVCDSGIDSRGRDTGKARYYCGAGGDVLGVCTECVGVGKDAARCHGIRGFSYEPVG
jgi:hypothetical protein